MCLSIRPSTLLVHITNDIKICGIDIHISGEELITIALVYEISFGKIMHDFVMGGDSDSKVRCGGSDSKGEVWVILKVNVKCGGSDSKVMCGDSDSKGEVWGF